MRTEAQKIARAVNKVVVIKGNKQIARAMQNKHTMKLSQLARAKA